jgi:hypothetical protein
VFVEKYQEKHRLGRDADRSETFYTGAADSVQRALQIAKHFGTSDNRVAFTYIQLGGTYRDWGHCAESRASGVW